MKKGHRPGKTRGSAEGNLLTFPLERADGQVARLKAFSDRLDAEISATLAEEELEVHEVAGILAHRLGTLMRPMDAKDKLWDLCEQVLKRQAVIE